MRRLLLAVVSGVVVGSAALVAGAQPITYQGRLAQGGGAATGSFDFEFRLFAVATGGTQIGAVVSRPGASVQDGLVTTQLDFGAGAFTGAPRWLEIRVRPTGGGAYTVLSPRQEVTAAPMAIRALQEWMQPAGVGVLTNDPSRARVLLNRTTPITNSEFFGFTADTGPGVYGGMYVNVGDSNGWPFYGYSTDGHARAWSYLLRNPPFEDSWRLNIGQQDRLVVAADGRVGIGVALPDERLDVQGGVRAEAYKYSAPATRTFTIPASGFTPQQGTLPYFVNDPLGLTYFASSVAGANMSAPVHLPHGATITGIALHAVDNSASDLSVLLLQQWVGATSNVFLANLSSSGAAPGVRTFTTSILHQVDNTQYGYAISLFSADWDGANTAVRAVQITYTVNGPE